MRGIEATTPDEPQTSPSQRLLASPLPPPVMQVYSTEQIHTIARARAKYAQKEISVLFQKLKLV